MTQPTHRPLPLQQVQLQDSFWSDYTELVRTTVIPYQWEALNDRVPGAEPSHAIRNFRIAAGLEAGAYGGLVFQDSDLAKWLESVGYSLSTHPDPELERIADEAIDLIVAAQQDDGYLNTYYTVKEPGRRWTNLYDCHEMYCAGHMIEAAVAYYRATGKRKLMDAMGRMADHIAEVFGTGPGQLRGYDGHQEIELALVKLYEATGEARFLRLSQFLIDERGREPHFYAEEWKRRGGVSHWSSVPQTQMPDWAYVQAHLPVREQTYAVGHAVRAVYMYAGMADLAAHTGDRALLEACRALWRNMTRKQMYVTGGIGSTVHGEAFTFDYDLPNATNYSETCASIGLIFFASRMLRLEAKSDYADVMERALYNTVLAGIAADGKHYFYVNPMEVWPEASARNPGRRHVKAVRQAWYGCACCPPNVARLLASLGEYVYSAEGAEGDTLYTHLYISGEARLSLGGGEVRMRQESRLPWSGDVAFTVETDTPQTFALALRIPAWTEGRYTARVNGEAAGAVELREGYAYLRRVWQAGDRVELRLAMPIQRLYAHPQVRSDAGLVALQRGPLVYCLEEADNPAPLAGLSLPAEAEITTRTGLPGLGEAVVLEAAGLADDAADWQEDELYRTAPMPRKTQRLTAVPYALWGNRGGGEMRVWMRS
ncbi:glycoside hydrolase family 127 protein [Paenibacillus sp. IB182496]|uniref:Glycoside hydrolase family 127 protein n=1 Tax=Paenibacillus sabuli TaxID=2772509 RepID=A0A927BV20_9BACL|nr:beta-L-arabinofuranosidase domain-containing protein [Paenibacillus sabuli]MBD2847363.1 glycoside hydrolase family 127 protein [Paenibacillus sabuli]